MRHRLPLLLLLSLYINTASAQQHIRDYELPPSQPSSDFEGSIDNFSWNGSEVIWQYIYECTEAADEIKQHFENLKTLENLKIKDNTILATRKRTKINFKPYNLGSFDYAALFGYPFDYHVQIDIKDSKYRITLSSFTFYPDTRVGMTIYGVSMSTNENTNYSLGLCYNQKRDKFRAQFTNTEGPILNDVLIKEFSITNKSNSINIDDEW